jgi:hypothetical protein
MICVTRCHTYIEQGTDARNRFSKAYACVFCCRCKSGQLDTRSARVISGHIPMHRTIKRRTDPDTYHCDHASGRAEELFSGNKTSHIAQQ